jgi:mRNA interferase MazF
MPIREHPPAGTILICNFNSDFQLPEMVKVRPVIVISPKIHGRPGLCTVVALSTTAPDPQMPFHAQISIDPRLPAPWDAESVWIKGDMVYAAAFQRLDLIRTGKDFSGKRKYYFTTVSAEQLRITRALVLRSIGLSYLTKHL